MKRIWNGGARPGGPGALRATRWLGLTGLILIGVLLAGCGAPAAQPAAAPTATTAPAAPAEPSPTPAPTATEEVMATAAVSATAEMNMTAAVTGTAEMNMTPAVTATVEMTGTPVATGPATVNLGGNDTLGKFLVDDKGMTLYLFTKDTKDTSNCYDKCATAWPPLYTQGAPIAGDGVDASLLGTTTRKDGTVMATYNGWPLYYYFKDQKPGDVLGQEVGGVWYVVSAQGEKIEGGAESATPGASATEPSSATPAAAGQTAKVDIKNFSFGDPLTISVGTTVTWTNQDSAAHTVTADDGSFDSGNIDQGATFSHTFDKAGTFTYKCKIHPSMLGTITVQ